MEKLEDNIDKFLLRRIAYNIPEKAKLKRVKLPLSYTMLMFVSVGNENVHSSVTSMLFCVIVIGTIYGSMDVVLYLTYL